MCSYCGCLEITVIGDLAREHEEIIEAAGVLRRADEADDVVAVRAAGHVLASLLGPHTRGEEEGLFAELIAVPEFAGHVGSLCAEHHALDDALAGICGGEREGIPAFLRSLRLHIAREEDGLFPAAAIALDSAAWGRLASAPA